MLTLPGLIDIHVHLRDPGQTEKEDFSTGTSAALAGGFTTVFDMPNNKTPITTLERLQEKIKSAKEKSVCNIGFYFGSLGDNLSEFEKVKKLVWGIKLYLNVTTGHYLVSEENLQKIYTAWSNALAHPRGVEPVLVHSEDETVDKVLNVVEKIRLPTHFCHVSSQYELSHIIEAKNQGFPVTCGVCPHHLFLTEEDVSTLKSYGIMKPSLKKKKDQQYLWKHISAIDVIESDHAPHTTQEKQSENPPFGVPGLETTLPLLLTAVYNGKITMDRVIEMCYKNPADVLHYRPSANDKIEVDMDSQYEIKGKNLYSKCKWSPFEGWKVRGRVRKVSIRGKKVYDGERILAKPGEGKVILNANEKI